jgi:transposase
VTAGPRAQRRLAAMNDTESETTIGLDVGSKFCVFCCLDQKGEVIEEGRVATTKKGLSSFKRYERAVVALEACADSPWIADLLEELGHDVLVANPRSVELITKSDRKNDRNDALLLARLARADRTLLSPIKHRATELRADLAVIRARDALVATRTKLINAVRGLTKSAGERLAKCSAESFHKKTLEQVPDVMRPALCHMLGVIEHTTKAIKEHDHLIEELAQTKYPEVSLLTEVAGIGTLTALTFVLTIGDRDRFVKSRDVGAYFGLVPRQQQSSNADPQLRISKTGDGLTRKLLVSAAHYVLGRFGPESDLRRWGLAIAARGGKNGKKRAVVAVARKLAVLLHRLWVTGEVYEPLRRSKRTSAATPDAVTESTNESTKPCGELRGQPTRVENAQKRPRKRGRVSHALPAPGPLHKAS